MSKVKVRIEQGSLPHSEIISENNRMTHAVTVDRLPRL